MSGLISQRRYPHGRAVALFASAVDDVADLVTALGGDTAVLGFYDARFGVTVSAGTVTQVDDARGASGFGPSLAGTGHAPTWDAVAKTVSNTAATMYLQSAASALFDLSASVTMINVMSVPAPLSSSFMASISDGATNTRILGTKNTATNGVIRTSVSGGASIDSAVNASDTVRCVISVSSSSARAIAVANATIARVASSALTTSASNKLTIFGSGTGATNDINAIWRATVIVAGDLGIGAGTAYTDAVRAVAAWAAKYHGAVLAS